MADLIAFKDEDEAMTEARKLKNLTSHELIIATKCLDKIIKQEEFGWKVSTRQIKKTMHINRINVLLSTQNQIRFWINNKKEDGTWENE